MRDASDLWDCRAVRLAGRGFPIYVNLERSQMINLAILGAPICKSKKSHQLKRSECSLFPCRRSRVVQGVIGTAEMSPFISRYSLLEKKIGVWSYSQNTRPRELVSVAV